MAQKVFQIYGPFDVPMKQGKKHQYIQLDCPPFWKKHPTHKTHKGCYVFGFKNKTFTPVYIGKTKKNFGAEAFTAHKIAQHYAPAIANTLKGKAIMFFVVAPGGVGAPPKKMIGDLEKFLIQTGVARNPELSNIQNRKEAQWGIKGIVRGGSGKTSREEKDFKKMMGI